MPGEKKSAFTCPRCGAHTWGSTGAHEPKTATVACQKSTLDGTGGCGWSGPYEEFVLNDDLPRLM
jgi:transcription elongation factor Elf1